MLRRRLGAVWIKLTRRARDGGTVELVRVNGEAGVLVRFARGDRSLLAFAVDRGRIVRIDVLRNPEKLRRALEL